MILLDYHNRVVYDSLLERFTSETPSAMDVRTADFDGVLFRLSTPESKTRIVLSMNMRCFGDLVSLGAMDVLNREYSSEDGVSVLNAPETGFDVSLEFNLDNIVGLDTSKKEKLAMKAALLKRNVMAAPFERAFEAHSKDTSTEIMTIPYRDEETIFVFGKHDRVTVIFQTTFKDEMDKVFGKVFLQEFVDARRQPSIQTAPQVLFSKEPPLELKDVANLRDNESTSYVTFVLFPRHFTSNQGPDSISRIQLFRDYLHYHIKCSKSYMHSRMRTRTENFLKVLNRAKPEIAEDKKEKKTASGRTFVRQ